MAYFVAAAEARGARKAEDNQGSFIHRLRIFRFKGGFSLRMRRPVVSDKMNYILRFRALQITLTQLRLEHLSWPVIEEMSTSSLDVERLPELRLSQNKCATKTP
jgi:hypothetical protein